MNTWEKIKVWFLGIGEDLFDIMRTPTIKLVAKYKPVATNIVIKAATLPNATGQEKFAYATLLMAQEVPGLLSYVVDMAIQTAYEAWKAKQEEIDTDGDGVPDYRDMCKELGAPAGGCVTEDGCPDSDCDGVPDKKDPCPEDPNCQ